VRSNSAITAGDKDAFRDTLNWLLVQPEGAGCQSWTEATLPNIDNPPSLKPTTDPGVVIRWHEEFKEGEKAAHFFDADGMKVSISHTMPANSPANLIWIDIGPGSPWKTK
jgi:hypothetical protein